MKPMLCLLLLVLSGCATPGMSAPRLPYDSWRLGFLAPPYMEVWTEAAEVEDINGRRWGRLESGTVSISYEGDANGWHKSLGWGNLALAGDVETAADDVKNGHGLSLSLGKGKRFPRLALQMIQVGEESGALDTMLLKTADTFEQETAQAIDRLLAAMVPAITLVLASVVGLVIVAVLVPLYDLTNAIG